MIDDHSTDKTCEMMAKFALKYDNVVWLEELPESMIKDYGTALNNLNSLVRDKNDKSITDV